jgi:thiamine kinase-like enzyme
MSTSPTLTAADGSTGSHHDVHNDAGNGAAVVGANDYDCCDEQQTQVKQILSFVEHKFGVIIDRNTSSGAVEELKSAQQQVLVVKCKAVVAPLSLHTTTVPQPVGGVGVHAHTTKQQQRFHEALVQGNSRFVIRIWKGGATLWNFHGLYDYESAHVHDCGAGTKNKHHKEKEKNENKHNKILAVAKAEVAGYRLSRQILTTMPMQKTTTMPMTSTMHTPTTTTKMGQAEQDNTNGNANVHDNNAVDVDHDHPVSIIVPEVLYFSHDNHHDHDCDDDNFHGSTLDNYTINNNNNNTKDDHDEHEQQSKSTWTTRKSKSSSITHTNQYQFPWAILSFVGKDSHYFSSNTANNDNDNTANNANANANAAPDRDNDSDGTLSGGEISSARCSASSSPPSLSPSPPVRQQHEQERRRRHRPRPPPLLHHDNDNYSDNTINNNNNEWCDSFAQQQSQSKSNIMPSITMIKTRHEFGFEEPHPRHGRVPQEHSLDYALQVLKNIIIPLHSHFFRLSANIGTGSNNNNNNDARDTISDNTSTRLLHQQQQYQLMMIQQVSMDGKGTPYRYRDLLQRYQDIAAQLQLQKRQRDKRAMTTTTKDHRHDDQQQQQQLQLQLFEKKMMHYTALLQQCTAQLSLEFEKDKMDTRQHPLLPAVLCHCDLQPQNLMFSRKRSRRQRQRSCSLKADNDNDDNINITSKHDNANENESNDADGIPLPQHPQTSVVTPNPSTTTTSSTTTSTGITSDPSNSMNPIACVVDWEEAALADPRFELILLCRKVCCNMEQAHTIWNTYSQWINHSILPYSSQYSSSSQISCNNNNNVNVDILGPMIPWLKLEALHSICIWLLQGWNKIQNNANANNASTSTSRTGIVDNNDEQEEKKEEPSSSTAAASDNDHDNNVNANAADNANSKANANANNAGAGAGRNPWEDQHALLGKLEQEFRRLGSNDCDGDGAYGDGWEFCNTKP